MNMTFKDIDSEHSNHLYQQIANQIHSMVTDGSIAYGQKLPSLRTIKKQFNISMTTALEAYHLLEDRGIIESKPQSGYRAVSYTHLTLPTSPKV